MSNLEPEGFVKDFKVYLLSRIPTSPIYVENIALTVLSAAVPKVEFPNRFGEVKLNIGTLMVGPSGLAYKSIPLNYYMFPLLSKLTELVGRPVILPNRYSVEGMIEYLSERDPKTKEMTQNEGVLARDEFTGMFKDFRGKRWLSDGMEFLSEILDGRIGKRYTRKMKLESVENLFASFISATTPYLYRILDRGFFEQGTGNRIMYIVYDGPTLDNVNYDNFFQETWAQVKKQELVGYASALAKIHKSGLRYVRASDEAGELWVDYKRRIDLSVEQKFLEHKYDLTYSYEMRLPENALKLAGLGTVSKWWKSIPSMTKQIIKDGLIVEEDIMKWAIDKADRHYDHFETLLRDWRSRPKEAVQSPSIKEEKEELLDILRNAPGKMLASPRWHEKSEIPRKTFYLYKQDLIDEGKVEEVEDPERTKLLSDSTTRKRIGAKDKGYGRTVIVRLCSI